MRTLCAWERDGKFYLSAMIGERTLNGRTPAKEYDTREALEAEIARRNGRIPGTDIDQHKAVELVWEYESNGG